MSQAGEPNAAPAPSDGHWAGLLGSRQVVVCAGSGGVGKTTVAAALGLGAAGLGRRTLCLTIDPARRLAQSLGLLDFSSDELDVPLDVLSPGAKALGGSLSVMMLDSGRTFDELVDQNTSSAETRALVKNNRLYQHLSRRLAGTHAYMAMEKVQALLAAGRFDVIVLDTPPSERALDFFDAPERMRQVIDSPVTKTLSKLSQSSGGKLGLRLVNSGVRGLLKGMGKVTGLGLLEELAELLALLDGLFGGFAARASEVGARMKSRQFGYVLVSAPHALALRSALSLATDLAARGITIDGLVVNRATPDPGPVPAPEAWLADPEFVALGFSARDQRSLEAAVSFDAQEAELQRRALAEPELAARFAHRVVLPDLAEPLHEAVHLRRFSERLLAGGAPRAVDG
jgi:anion-transporting  ArsA/GET3 family ATPase